MAGRQSSGDAPVAHGDDAGGPGGARKGSGRPREPQEPLPAHCEVPRFSSPHVAAAAPPLERRLCGRLDGTEAPTCGHVGRRLGVVTRHPASSRCPAQRGRSSFPPKVPAVPAGTHLPLGGAPPGRRFSAGAPARARAWALGKCLWSEWIRSVGRRPRVLEHEIISAASRDGAEGRRGARAAATAGCEPRLLLSLGGTWEHPHPHPDPQQKLEKPRPSRARLRRPGPSSSRAL